MTTIADELAAAELTAAAAEARAAELLEQSANCTNRTLEDGYLNEAAAQRLRAQRQRERAAYLRTQL